MQEQFDPSNPYHWIRKYRTTTTPQLCRVCNRTAYYVHPTLGHLCASHLLDLANVGELNWKWCDWEDVWQMMGRLLGRKSGGADVTHIVLKRLAMIANTLDGWKTCPKCQQKLEISLFNKDRANLDGYARICRECDNSRRREIQRKKKR